MHANHLRNILGFTLTLLVTHCVHTSMNVIKMKFIASIYIILGMGERGGSVVECRTPEREVGGSRPTAAVLCP